MTKMTNDSISLEELEARLKADADERTARRRPVIEACVEKFKRNRRQAHARMVPNWTDQELDTLRPIADRHRAGELSYYAACVEGRKVLPGRSWNAIRKKIKNYTGHGAFKP